MINNVSRNAELLKGVNLTQLQSKIQKLEDELKQLLEKEEQRDKSELELVIDNFDEISLSNRIKAKKITKNKFKMNEEYLNKLLKESKEGFIRVDEKGMVKDITSKVLKLLSYKKVELRDKPFKSICPWADKLSKSVITMDAPHHKLLFHDRGKFSLTSHEMFVLDKKNTEIPCQIKASSLTDSNNKFNGTIILLKDNKKQKNLVDKLSNEKKRLEEFAKKSPEKKLIKKLQDEHEARTLYLEQIIDSSSDGITVADSAGFIKRVNKTFAKITGYLTNELVGKHMAELYPHEDREFDTTYGEKHLFIRQDANSLIMESSDALFSDKGETHLEIHMQRKDGVMVPVDCSLYWIYDKDGKRLDAVSIVRDITGRKKAEKALEKAYDALQQSKDYLEKIFVSSADGIVVFDLIEEGKKPIVSMVNNAFEKLSGYQAEEVIGESLDELLPPDNLMEEKMKGHEFDIVLPSDDPKHPRILRVRSSVISGKDGRQTGIVAILHDATHEREVDRMKTEFISTAAHELRTPLTSIQGFSEIMLTRNDITDEEKKRFLSYINKQSVSLTLIVSDLLDIARIESGKGFALNRTPFDIRNTIEQAIPYFQENAAEHRFEVVSPNATVEVHADKQKIEQVFKNLLGNAVKYSPQGGLIRVTSTVSAGQCEIAIEDHGMGMSAEQVERVFDKFYRVDASNSSIEGTGLGMTIVKYIVESHGGKIWVESKLGKGTTVRFTIPQ